MEIKGRTMLRKHNTQTLKHIDEVYPTNLKGLKVAKYEGGYYMWCKKWWYCFSHKAPFIEFLTNKNIQIMNVEEEEYSGFNN